MSSNEGRASVESICMCEQTSWQALPCKLFTSLHFHLSTLPFFQLSPPYLLNAGHWSHQHSMLATRRSSYMPETGLDLLSHSSPSPPLSLLLPSLLPLPFHPPIRRTATWLRLD